MSARPAPLVFITGASSGIGQALAARYAQAGWRLALVARRTAVLQAWADEQGLGAERCSVYGADVAEPDSIVAAARACLRQQGLRLGLLSGDLRASVEGLGRRLGLRPEELAWDQRPEQKLERLLLAHREGAVAMVGDGVNDAPALAAADLGIAVGTGTQIAQESAALVVMGADLDGIVRALEIARRTMAKVRQNLAWAFGYNLIVLPIAAGVLLPGFGLRLSPELAALLMAFRSLTVVGNALLLQGSQQEHPS
jgi:Cu2+-exporting ATPase